MLLLGLEKKGGRGWGWGGGGGKGRGSRGYMNSPEYIIACLHFERGWTAGRGILQLVYYTFVPTPDSQVQYFRTGSPSALEPTARERTGMYWQSSPKRVRREDSGLPLLAEQTSKRLSIGRFPSTYQPVSSPATLCVPQQTAHYMHVPYHKNPADS